MFRPYTNNKDIAANLGVSGCLVNELTPTIVNLLSCREWLILSPFCLFFLEIALASAKNLKSTFYSDSSAHTQSTSSSTALVAKLQSWTSDYVWQSFIGIGQIFFNIEFWIIAYLYIVIFVWLLKSFGFHLICCYIKFKLIQHQPLWNQLLKNSESRCTCNIRPWQIYNRTWSWRLCQWIDRCLCIIWKWWSIYVLMCRSGLPFLVSTERYPCKKSYWKLVELFVPI